MPGPGEKQFVGYSASRVSSQEQSSDGEWPTTNVALNDAHPAQSRWRCSVGHDVPDLTRGGEVVVLDGGAEILVCREHQAPLTVTATGTSERPVDWTDSSR